MEYIRLLHPYKFDHFRGCFSEIAFANHEADGSASVIDKRCIDSEGMSYCKHIKKFYSRHIRGEPSAFWIFDESILPHGSKIEDGSHPKD
jgi:hypothetical protein